MWQALVFNNLFLRQSLVCRGLEGYGGLSIDVYVLEEFVHMIMLLFNFINTYGKVTKKPAVVH